MKRLLIFGVWVVTLSSSGALGVRGAEAALDSLKVTELSATPLVLRTPAGERAVWTAELRSGELTGLSLRLSAAGWPEQTAKTVERLPAGTNRLELLAPLIASPTAVTLSASQGGATKDFGPFQLEPTRLWTVYLSQHTHTDIGYTRPQTEILPEHLRYIDFALDYCDLTDGLPDDAQFRWTCETFWAVREYLQRRPAAQTARLKRRVQEGRIELAGMLLNMSEIATESSLAASLQPLLALQNEFGVTARTAMQNDVNGAAWCLVDYFQPLGLRYLVMGINQTRSILPFDKPTTFWWESPSGKRLLAFRADHYMTANFWHLQEGQLDRVRPELVKYLRSLEQRKYAFDRIGVQFSGYFTDNSPPSTRACGVVKAWNEQYAWPRLRLSTAQEFPAWVEQAHGGELPVYRVAWPDWWTDGFGSAARETAAARATESAMQVSQGLLALGVMAGTPVSASSLRRVADIQDALLFYAEHTYGAAESIDDPLAENTQVQWGEKAAYVWEAVKQANLLREEAWGLVQDHLPRAETPTIAVINTLNWPRSGLVKVFIDHQILPGDNAFRIVDLATKTPVLAQSLQRRSEGTYWALWVPDVPPQGYRLLAIESGPDKRPPEPSASTNQFTLDNRYYTVVIDPAKGAVSRLLDKETGQELVDASAEWALGQCLYETPTSGRDLKPGAFRRTSLRNVRVTAGAGGPIWQSLRLNGDLDGCVTNRGFQAEFRLYETEKRLEFLYTARKQSVRSPEALYVAFPFRCPDGKVRYEGQGGVVSPGENQLPGSASDWQTIQNFVSVQGAENQILWGSEEAPLVQLGEINLGKWMPVTKVQRPHVYSWVMNNYWFTNFRADQEGEFKWSYYLTSLRDKSTTAAARFGWGSRVSLATRVFPPGRAGGERPWSASWFTVNGPNLLLVEARPARGEGVMMHLRELEGRRTTISENDVMSRTPLREAHETDVLGQVRREGLETLILDPYEAKFVRLVF